MLFIQTHPCEWLVKSVPQQTHTRILTYFSHQKTWHFLGSVAILLPPFPLPSLLLFWNVVIQIKIHQCICFLFYLTKQCCHIANVGNLICRCFHLWHGWCLSGSTDVPSRTQIDISIFTNLHVICPIMPLISGIKIRYLCHNKLIRIIFVLMHGNDYIINMSSIRPGVRRWLMGKCHKCGIRVVVSRSVVWSVK